MKLAGFNFTKIVFEKKKDSFKELKIETKINILDIQEIKEDLIKSKDTFVSVNFSYIIEYSPEIANLEFEGKCILSVDQRKARDLIKDWKDKKIDDEFKIALFNLILIKSNIKALQYEEELNLPLHFRLPSLSASKEGINKK
jgi:hypothetical protein